MFRHLSETLSTFKEEYPTFRVPHVLPPPGCTSRMCVVLQVGSILGFLLIVIIAVVGGVLYQSSWVISPALWIIGAIFPLLGFSLGFLLARLVGQPWVR